MWRPHSEKENNARFISLKVSNTASIAKAWKFSYYATILFFRNVIHSDDYQNYCYSNVHC